MLGKMNLEDEEGKVDFGFLQWLRMVLKSFNSCCLFSLKIYEAEVPLF